MSTLDKVVHDKSVADAVYKSWELREASASPRGHLGCSEIGEDCERKLWLKFRRCHKPVFEGRILRLFDRGKREEEIVHMELVAAGMEVADTQRHFLAGFGHFGGSCDGIVTGVPGAESTPHILEVKTHSAKSFATLESKGVEASHPKHFAQMQCYMAFSKLTRALYYAVNKDDDTIYTERIREDKKVQAALFKKAERIVFSEAPPDRPYKSPADYRCKMCDMNEVCWQYKRPKRDCRNCVAATPKRDGQWSCDNLFEFVDDGKCEHHLFIPPVVSDEYEMGKDGCIWHTIDKKIVVDCPHDKFPEVKKDIKIEIME